MHLLSPCGRTAACDFTSCPCWRCSSAESHKGEFNCLSPRLYCLHWRPDTEEQDRAGLLSMWMMSYSRQRMSSGTSARADPRSGSGLNPSQISGSDGSSSLPSTLLPPLPSAMSVTSATWRNQSFILGGGRDPPLSDQGETIIGIYLLILGRSISLRLHA